MKPVGLLTTCFAIVFSTIYSFGGTNLTSDYSAIPSNDLENCEEGFSSQIKLTHHTNECFTYEIEVAYDGTGDHELSFFAVEVPCGSFSQVTNSMGWAMETGTDPHTGLNGFKLEANDGFGGENSPGSFTVTFQVCGDNDDCVCTLSEYAPTVGYKAATCVYTQDLSLSNPINCPAEITENIKPVLECVEFNPANNNYTAHFGYLNENDVEVSIPVGGDNKFTPSPIDRGQPTLFLPGRQVDVFQVEFDGNNLVWTLASPNGSRRTSTASDNPDQRCEDNRCEPESITGGSIVFNGPYNPQDQNIIENTELPSSPFDGVDFEYIWLQSEVNVVNTPGNPYWSVVDGSENLTELEVSGLTKTMYYIRCARIAGCEMYWGETNTVEVAVDPCQPEDIDGGSIVFNGPYNPTGQNIIENTELPSSPFDGVDFEYIWLQSEVNVVNTPGNPYWSVVDGSENLTDLEVSGLTQTMYYIRCARIAGCEMYWGETNTVEVEVFENPTATLSGGGQVCPGNTATLTIALTGASPFTITYTNGTENTEITIEANEYSFEAGPGNYSLVSVSDANYDGTVSGEAIVTEYTLPTASISGGGEVCGDGLAIINIELTGTAPFNVIYNNGSENIEVTSEDNNYSFEGSAGTYTLVNVTDANCEGTVSGEATVTQYEMPSAIISGDASVCGGETSEILISLTGSAPFNGVYTNGSENIEYNTSETTYSFTASTGTYTLISINDANCEGTVSGSATITENGAPTASISGDGNICEGEMAAVNVSLTGTAPFTFTYSDGSQNIHVTTEANDYTINASAGTYTLIEVSDANCVGSVSGEVIVSTYETPTAVISGDASVCTGESAEIMVSLTGSAPFNGVYTNGSENFEFNTSESAYTFTASTGTYTLLSINDANCEGTVSGSATIVANDSPTASISGNSNICDEETATVTISMTGESPFNGVYTDGISNTEYTTSEYTYTFVAGEGNYNLVSISDANCEGSVSGEAVIVSKDRPTAEISGNTTICPGETATVSISLTGTAPYEITYTDGTINTTVESQSNEYSFEASSGNYSLVSVTDANCTGTVSGSATIQNLESPTAKIDGGGTVCEGELSEITVSFSGTSPFEFSYSDGSTTTTVQTSLYDYSFMVTAGTYTLVSLSDANCTGSASGTVTIDNYTSPTATISGDASICGSETATVTISLTGVAPFNIVYTNGSSNTSVQSNTDLYTFQASQGTYTLVSVSDANCKGNVSGSATISGAQAPTAEISGTADICQGETATVTVSLTGTAPWTFEYSTGKDPIAITTSSSIYTFEVSSSTTYSLESVVDANCTGEASGKATVTVLSDPSGSLSLNDTYCESESVSLSPLLVVTSSQTYAWSTTGTGTLQNANQANASYLPSAQDGIVEFSLLITNDCGSTTLTASTEIIHVNASYTITPEPTNGALLTDVEYTFNPADPGNDTYSWNFGDGSTSNTVYPTHTYQQSGDYVTSLTVTKSGCTSSTKRTVSVQENNNLFVPNAISPTSTNTENNTVKVYGENISPEKFTFEIYNRWGLQVYQTTNLSEAQNVGWDGSVKNEENENNVFTYVLRGSFNDGNIFEETGTITLVK